MAFGIKCNQAVRLLFFCSNVDMNTIRLMYGNISCNSKCPKDQQFCKLWNALNTNPIPIFHCWKCRLPFCVNVSEQFTLICITVYCRLAGAEIAKLLLWSRFVFDAFLISIQCYLAANRNWFCFHTLRLSLLARAAILRGCILEYCMQQIAFIHCPSKDWMEQGDLTGQSGRTIPAFSPTTVE